MRKWIIRFIVFLGFVGALWVFREWVLVPEPILVSVIQVERGRVEETMTNSRAGTVKARQRANLSPEIGGTRGVFSPTVFWSKI